MHHLAWRVQSDVTEGQAEDEKERWKKKKRPGKPVVWV
jgi:hypothetical protein